jgi:prepilin-type N-terminal cleavage/methylation domain-containing protein
LSSAAPSAKFFQIKTPMKTPRNTPATAHAFTLIELLTVIAIIAILMGLLFPVMGVVKETAKKTQAKNEVVQIVSAVKLYYTEYGKYPVYPTSTTTDITYGDPSTNANNLLFDTLRNNNPTQDPAKTLNPRQISYIEASVAKDQTNPKSGIKSTTGVWYDPWGSPYNVALDGNYNGVVTAPAYTDLTTNYTTASDGSGDKGVATGVIVWSYGRNGMLGGDGAGATIPSGFTKEGGTANQLSGSGDVVSWQ